MPVHKHCIDAIYHRLSFLFFSLVAHCLERRSCNKEKKKNKMKIRQRVSKGKTKKENLLLHLIHILKTSWSFKKNWGGKYEQLIQSNESNERKLTLSCMSEWNCAKLCHHSRKQLKHQRQKITNGHFRKVRARGRSLRLVFFSRGWRVIRHFGVSILLVLKVSN